MREDLLDPVLSALPPRATEKVQALLGLHWLECLTGWVPPGIAAPVDVAHPRVRALRHHPRFAAGLRQDRIGRFWHREWRLTVVRSQIMLRAAPFNRGATIPVTLHELARAAGLSVKTVQDAIERAAATGDLAKRRATQDGRLLTLEPSARLWSEAARLREEFLDMASGFLGRPSPVPGMPAEAQLEVARVLLAMVGTMARPGDKDVQPQEMRRTFVFLMLDLLIEGPQARRGFIGAEAKRLLVTPMTIRNVIARAQEMGWLEPGAELVATPLARERFGLALAALERRWVLLFDAFEAIADAAAEAGPAVPARRPLAGPGRRESA